MVGAVGAGGSTGAVGLAAGGGNATLASPTTSAPPDVVPASSTVSLSTAAGPLLFGNGAVGSVGAYSAVQAMNSTSLDVNYLSARTGLSMDFVNGFVSGLYSNMPSQNSSLEKLSDALILALLLEMMERRRN